MCLGRFESSEFFRKCCFLIKIITFWDVDPYLSANWFATAELLFVTFLGAKKLTTSYLSFATSQSMCFEHIEQSELFQKILILGQNTQLFGRDLSV